MTKIEFCNILFNLILKLIFSVSTVLHCLLVKAKGAWSLSQTFGVGLNLAYLLSFVKSSSVSDSQCVHCEEILLHNRGTDQLMVLSDREQKKKNLSDSRKQLMLLSDREEQLKNLSGSRGQMMLLSDRAEQLMDLSVRAQQLMDLFDLQ